MGWAGILDLEQVFMRITTARGTSLADSSYTSWCLAISEVMGLWSELEPLIKKALAAGYDELSAESIFAALCQGEMTAFVTVRKGKVEAVCVVEITQFPGFRAANVVCLSGRTVRAAAYFLPGLEAWVLSNQAVEIRGYCSNPALVRLYRQIGLPFRPAYTVLRYDLRRKLQ
jgi:hypothetical protein